MANYMEEIAKMLGVKMGERFKINGEKYYITKEGLFDDDDDLCTIIFMHLLTGKYTIEKLPWKPKMGKIYFKPCIKGDVVTCEWFGDICDFESYYAGTCFETAEEAEAHTPKIIEKLKSFYEDGGHMMN